MIKSLLSDFEVDVVTPVASENEKIKSAEEFGKLGVGFYPLHSKKHQSNKLRKRFFQIRERFYYYLLGYDLSFVTARQYENAILRLIRSNPYDIVISNYWEISDFFRKSPDKLIKILDTHYSVKENIEVFEKNGYYSGNSFFKKRELHKSLKIEKRIIEASNIVLSLSSKCYQIFSTDYPHIKHLMIPDGNDVGYYSEIKNQPDGNTIVFYGSMGSAQNIGAFWRTYNKILPLIKMQVPDIKLFVVGNKPPSEIKALHNGKDIIITGFIEDVRPILSKGKLLIIPLEIGSGFRGRIVEVMSVGLPVVGTHNALDSIEMQSGVHGLISDDDQEMAQYCIRLLTDEDFRLEKSEACQAFVREKYSLEATFDKLTEFLCNTNNKA
jgi:glycosyltransferase involved in cell wall biosynthesis